MRYGKMLAVAAAVATTLLAGSASAATLPFGTLSLVQPTGFVSPTDTIDIELTFTLGAGSPSLQLANGTYAPSTYFTDADLQARGFDTSQSVIGFVTVGVGCNGSLNTCTADFYQLAVAPPTGTLFSAPSFTLNEGESVTYKASTLLPSNGPVPTGTYSFNDNFLYLGLFGLNLAGAFHFSAGDAIGTTRETFSRTVVGATAVPEPATWVMMIAGFGLVGGAARWRVRSLAMA